MYLFNSKESGVQSYIGNRMFTFPHREVDFYLQQLVNMYIHMHDVAEVIHPYLVLRQSLSMTYIPLIYHFYCLVYYSDLSVQGVCGFFIAVCLVVGWLFL